MSECPACGKPVDALRARNVIVIAGRVVAFCSPECAQHSPAGRGDRTDGRAAATGAGGEQPRRAPAARKDQTPVPKKPRTPPAGVAAVADIDSGPVIEIIHEPASGVVTSAPDARTGLTKASDFAEASGDIQISEGDEPAKRGSGRTWLVLLALVVLGGGAVVAYELGYLGPARASHAATVPAPALHAEALAPAPPPPVVAPKPAPPAIDYVGAARDVLHGELVAKDRHLARLAAEALARTGASEAMVALIDDLGTEQSSTAKLEIDYVLARGEDRRGTDGLVAALDAPVSYDHPEANRLAIHDDRLDAASRLAKLGDKRAVPVLARYLDAPEQRLGAASALAYLAEPKAIDALVAVRKDAAASAADKASAAIALAIAGKADVAPALLALLADPHFNADAAGALAELHDADPAVKRVLFEQLKFPSLCVGAARALRRLDAGLDVHAQLDALLAAARAATGPDRIADAEAVLLLAGSPEWSEHP